jgi:hypothetical protein
MKETTFSDTAMIASFEAILFPIQKLLWKSCRIVRVCSSVFLWKDSYLAFWITTLSFSASFLAFWIPWAWLIQWEFRLFVWPLFGPWMKLVDIYYIQREKNNPKGEEIISQSETEILENLYNRILGQDEWNAVCRENALKNKDMKRYMFGKVRIVQSMFLCILFHARKLYYCRRARHFSFYLSFEKLTQNYGIPFPFPFPFAFLFFFSRFVRIRHFDSTVFDEGPNLSGRTLSLRASYFFVLRALQYKSSTGSRCEAHPWPTLERGHDSLSELQFESWTRRRNCNDMT